MGEKSALVIGAGIAGLAAAYHLARSGWDVGILEGRDRIGGRIWTFRDTLASGPIELGAEFVHGEKVETWDFIRRAGLATHEVALRQWHTRDGRLTQDDSFADEFGQLTQRIDLAAPDKSVQAFLDQATDIRDPTRWQLREYVEGFHAADLTRMSVQALARAEQAAETVEGTRQFRITQGYGALLDWLRAELGVRGVKVHCQTVVKAVRWMSRAVEVLAETSGGKQSFAAAAVIVTVPLGVLKDEGPASLAFQPELPGKVEALAGLEMGNVMKVVLRFKSRFWPVENFGFIHSTDEWLPTWWADERGALLTGWAGGPRAQRLNSAEEAFLRTRAIRALSRIFEVETKRVAGLLEKLHVHHWTQDPWARGAYSYIGVGGMDAPRRLAEPVEHTVFFAGEALAEPGQQGTVHGAIASGRRAAESLMQA
jgi:monoamine oxidase